MRVHDLDFVRFVARKQIYIFAVSRATEHKRIANERSRRSTGRRITTRNARELVMKKSIPGILPKLPAHKKGTTIPMKIRQT